VKIGILVGTRPEIVKMASVVRACAARRVKRVLIHTGQHYSYALDGVFFAQLGLPKPDVNLAVGSGSATQQIARMIGGLEEVLLRSRPDILLVEGDTNSVLAGALAAQKLGIRVGHVEAGLRSYDRAMPEEINRVVTDHLSDVLFAPTKATKTILRSEGIPAARIAVTGNTVVDELLRQRPRAEKLAAWRAYGLEPGKYVVATVHRPENTESPERLAGIFEGFLRAAAVLRLPILIPLHPRTRKRLGAITLRRKNWLCFLDPLGYLEFLGLCSKAALILSDSGGLQEEACTLGVPCVTLRDTTERPESVEAGANVLAGADPKKIAARAKQMIRKRNDWKNPFGDGRAAERIVDSLLPGGRFHAS
jgi:UDP-N-acetylglucosamine 2-epimerase (non-hydrolysing)